MLSVNNAHRVQLAAQPTQDFLDNRLAATDPVFSPYTDSSGPCAQPAVATVHDRQSPLESSLALKSDDFRSAVAAFDQSRNGKDSGALDLVQASSWTDVIRQVEIAQRQYEGSATSGFLGSLRGRLRSFGDYKEPVEAWLELLPSQSWQGSLVCGGVVIVFKAASRLGAIRDDICEALEYIPESIDSVQKLGQVYPEAGFLQLRASEMCIAVLDLLQHMIEWYTKSPIRKTLKAIVKGDAYGRELQARIEKITTLRRAVERQANVAGHVEGKQTSQKVLGSLAVLLDDRKKQRDYQRELDELRMQVQRAREREARQNAEFRHFLLRILDYRPSHVLQDLMTTMRDGSAEDPECHERAAWILNSPLMAKWLDDPRSSILVVNSGEDDHDSRSAVSFFTSMLVRALDPVKPATTLHWFCNQRRTDSVYSMLKSLVCQLVHNAHSLEIPPHLADGGRISIGRMATFLTRCLKIQLRSASVFILLDSLSYYENGTRVGDICWLLERIAEVVNDQPHSSGYTLKVLVTSPTRFSRLGRVLEARDAILLDVPIDVASSRIDMDDRRLIEGFRSRLSLQGQD